MKLIKLRVMQGRILPPTDGHYQSFPYKEWQRELSLAKEAMVDGVEWIVDQVSWEINPLLTKNGRREIRTTCAECDVTVDSVCADVFMVNRLLTRHGAIVRTHLDQLDRILQCCSELGMRYVILPFVDSSRLQHTEELDGVHRLLNELVNLGSKYEVEVHLETDLMPQVIGELFRDIDSRWVGMNYDIGNSASLGYSHRTEFKSYGEQIKSVHIKDRILNGGSVPLGTGDADIPGVISELGVVAYEGDFVLQIARASPGDEVSWITENAIAVREMISRVWTKMGNRP